MKSVEEIFKIIHKHDPNMSATDSKKIAVRMLMSTRNIPKMEAVDLVEENFYNRGKEGRNSPLKTSRTKFAFSGSPRRRSRSRSRSRTRDVSLSDLRTILTRIINNGGGITQNSPVRSPRRRRSPKRNPRRSPPRGGRGGSSPRRSRSPPRGGRISPSRRRTYRVSSRRSPPRG